MPKSKHHILSVYGISHATSRTLWKIIGDRLLEIDALIVGDFKVLKLTNIAKKILTSEQTVDIRQSNLQTTRFGINHRSKPHQQTGKYR
jgi:ATP-dependent DNA helicase RecQ